MDITTHHAGSPMTTILPDTTTEPSTTTSEPTPSTTKAAEVVSEIPPPTGQTALVIKEICSQASSIGLTTGTAVGGFAIGVLLTVVTTLFIVVLIHATRKWKNTKNAVSLVAVNPMIHVSKQEEETKEPEYCNIITNPASRKVQLEMTENECYATIR